MKITAVSLLRISRKQSRAARWCSSIFADQTGRRRYRLGNTLSRSKRSSDHDLQVWKLATIEDSRWSHLQSFANSIRNGCTRAAITSFGRCWWVLIAVFILFLWLFWKSWRKVLETQFNFVSQTVCLYLKWKPHWITFFHFSRHFRSRRIVFAAYLEFIAIRGQENHQLDGSKCIFCLKCSLFICFFFFHWI